MNTPSNLNNYQRFREAHWAWAEDYLPAQAPNPALYQPVATWIGRLILPERTQRDTELGCLFELRHTDSAHEQWIGRTVRLRYARDTETQARLWAVTRNVIFDELADKFVKEGLILSERINRWRMVSPLESLAAGHPTDNLLVRLREPVEVEESPPDGGPPILRIRHEPVQITGPYKALVTFLRPMEGSPDCFHVRHFNPVTRQFDGAEETIYVPPVVANSHGIAPSTSAEIEKSPLNADGWYIYGAQNRDGFFVVQAWAPRALLRLTPQRVISDAENAWKYIRHDSWANPVAHKGTITSVLCAPGADAESAVAAWKEGDRALLLHVYSGIGGKLREPAARGPIYFGHFAFGVAEVVREPLADELRFEITYHQVYTHNVDGLVAGTLDWSRYLGDRQLGWAGSRPTCDILIKLDELNDAYQVDGQPHSVLNEIEFNLEQMTARYRIGDGRGATFVAAANNCAQDSAQAFYAALVRIRELILTGRDFVEWEAANPEQAARLQRVRLIGRDLKQKLIGGNARRNDWRYGVENLGTSENSFRNLLRGLGTWRTLLPRKASDTYAQVFLNHGAALWVLRTDQIGGSDPDIEPLPPWTF